MCGLGGRYKRSLRNGRRPCRAGGLLSRRCALSRSRPRNRDSGSRRSSRLERRHVDRRLGARQGGLGRGVRTGSHSATGCGIGLNRRAYRGTRRSRLRSALRGCLGGCALAQLLARSFACPCARIDVANDVQPFLGFFERREVAHVQAEALTAVLTTAADEEVESLQLRDLSLLERHGRRRGAQVEDVRSRLRSASRCRSTGRRRPCFPGSGACDSTRCQCWRWCHKPSPDRATCPARLSRKPPGLQGRIRSTWGSASVRARRDRGSPAVIGIRPLDRWLCVPAFRRVCPYQRRPSVEATPI